jgi:DHA2 family methylenomycin A resistance protein-like MFS transporter
VGDAEPAEAIPPEGPAAIPGMGGALASTSGPVLGGLLTLVSWRLIFIINVPVGVVALVLLARSAPSPHRRARFDWVGQITAVLSMGGLTYGAIEAGAVGIGDPRVVGAFVVAAVALAMFVLVEARIPHPVLHGRSVQHPRQRTVEDLL